MNAPTHLRLNDDYLHFLEEKAKVAKPTGFWVPLEEINPALAPHVRLGVQWAFHGGQRALFWRFGLHKTCAQLELMRLAGIYRNDAFRIIVLPLGVRLEFLADAMTYFTGAFAIRVQFVQTQAEITDKGVIYLTNPESVREGKIDPTGFSSSMDEADLLRGFGGSKTFREFMRIFEYTDTLRFVATATPDPSEYIELLAYAAYLGIMDVGQAKTRFFQRDSQKADNLTLRPHKELEFWLWVGTWALFVTKPSDIHPDLSDEGYTLPPLVVRWHEIPSDHVDAGTERNGQGKMFADASLGVVDASKEKRRSLPERIAKLMEIRAQDPGAHRILWHDLEDERKAIEAAIPSAVSVYGTQKLEDRETAIIAFKEGRIPELAAKPVMLGAGSNLQRHCHHAVFLGIGFKFRDLIQAIHRIARFGQAFTVYIDLIYTEAERGIREEIERRWKQYDEQLAKMTALVREHGLANVSAAASMQRQIGVEREVASGEGWTLVLNDNVLELRARASNSIALYVSSLPFSNQYEYTPSYNDFGHTDDNRHFFEQMDFLTPEIYRTLMPGRVCAIHVKDRITPSGLTGMGFQCLEPFSDQVVAHFRKHGFGFLARKTVVTDVVRENNQTYRLGWSEQCKDGSRMGAGLPEYVLLFRKPPTDRSRGYADLPVLKAKKWWVGINDHDYDEDLVDEAAPENDETAVYDGYTAPDGYWKNPQGYSRAQWQLDAHGFTRSNGNRLLAPDDLVGLTHKAIYRVFRDHSRAEVYDFAQHVRIAERLEQARMLPSKFMLLPPASWHPDVWADVARMRTLNGEQSAKGKEKHLCPLQFDIVERLIAQFSQPGEEVGDFFDGLGTVPLMAVKLGRRGWGCELNGGYWADSVSILRAEERKSKTPSLFDALEQEAA